MGESSFAPREPLPRLEPFGPGDTEAAFWNNEADAIEAELVLSNQETDAIKSWRADVNNPEAHMQGVLKDMYAPSDLPASTDIGNDLGSDLGPDV